MLASRCGYSADLSAAVNGRALTHVDNAYFLEHVEVVSHRCKTHTVSNTAFRGFGGPQALVVIEQVIDEIARALSLDPLDVRRANFYGIGERDTTYYGQKVEDNVIPDIADRLERTSRYRERRADVAAWNAANPVIKRGLALTPVKFGISFTATQFNQAGALVNVYSDGTVLLNHGGTEMGQGLHIKVAQVVATELGVPLSAVRISATDTSKVPNTSATAASSGSDLNGMAALAAARTIRLRLVDYLCETHGVAPSDVKFADGSVTVGSRHLSFREVVAAAYLARDLAVVHRLLPHTEDFLGQGGDDGPAVLLFRLRCGGVRGGHRHADRRNAAPAGRYPARRGLVAESCNRSRAGRRWLSAGRGLADQRRALLERARTAAHARAVHLQDSGGQRLAGARERGAARACAQS